MSREEKYIKIPMMKSIADTKSDRDEHTSLKRAHDVLDDDETKTNVEEPKKKIAFGLCKPKKILQASSVSMKLPKLGSQQKPVLASNHKSKIGKSALAFSEFDDDEEEMPPEAKMRMKNIGRETPTSSGPNSFGKGRMGFSDSKKVFERKLNEEGSE